MPRARARARGIFSFAFGLRGHIFGFCFSAGLPREVGPVRAPQQNIHRHIIMIHGILSSGVVGTLRFRGSLFLHITYTLQMAVYVLFRERQGGETCPWSPTGLPSRAGPRAKYGAPGQTPRARQKSQQDHRKEACRQRARNASPTEPWEFISSPMLSWHFCARN